MTAATRQLVIRPADVTGTGIGRISPSADATSVMVRYDRRVCIDGMWIDPMDTPARAVDGFGWACQVYCNDDPAITQGAGFKVIVTITVRPKQGIHGHERTWQMEYAPNLASPAWVVLGTQPAPASLPYFVPASSLSGVAYMADPDDPDGGYYYSTDKPSDGQFTITPLEDA